MKGIAVRICPVLVLAAGCCAVTLDKAARTGDLAGTKRLLIGGADVNTAFGSERLTALSLAASSGHAEVARILILAGANVNARDNFGRTPLIWAAFHGNAEVVRVLLENGATPDATDVELGRTPLTWSAGRGDPKLVELLLASGVDINARDKDGFTALAEAVCMPSLGSNGVEVVKLLLTRGADPNARTANGHTPFRTVAYSYSGLSGLVDIFRQHGATVTLLEAAVLNNTNEIRRLIDQGANIEIRDRFGFTPLMRAASRDNMEAAKILIDEGADVNAKNGDGEALLKLTVKWGYNDLADLLRKHGARESFGGEATGAEPKDGR